MKLAACVILYNPENRIIKNIESYLEDIDYLIIYDNSSNPIVYDFSFIPRTKYEYITQKKNIGVAAALNTAAKKARKMGFEWLLTMDQDSFFYKNGIGKLKEALFSTGIDQNKIGIISPMHVDATKMVMVETVEHYRKVDIVMTSGNILNLKAWTDVGFFEEKLFIDGVDYDFCLRLALKNYKVLIASNSFLIHPVGDIKNLIFLGKKVQVSRHSHIRIYYMVRNGFYLVFKYYKYFPKHCSSLFFQQLINPIKIVLFEKEKTKKIRFYFLGLKDFVIKKYGKEHYK